jgi:nucleotide-binding universal stress UspA family protein
MEYAGSLARRHPAMIRVLHVMPFVPTLDHYPPLIEPETLRTIQPTEMKEQLKAFADSVFGRGVQTALVVRQGDPATEILRAARGIDMVALGTHGRRGFEKWLLGSVAERVLHRAACPVLTASTKTLGVAGGKVGRILCAADFSKASRQAIRHAVALAKRHRARLTLLHVVDWSPRAELPLYVHQANLGEYRRFVEAHTLRRLGKAVPPRVALPQLLVRSGRPHEEILRVAKLLRADLIVLGVHGRSRLDLALFGSTANRVVQGASCPVLTVRSRSPRR